MSFSTALLHHPRTLFLLLALIMALGLSALLSLPRQEDPALLERWIRIDTAFAGADAERVESLISIPLEKALAGIAEIKTIKSISRAGNSTLTVTLKDAVTEVDEVWARVRDRLAFAREHLPEGTGTPRITRLSTMAVSLLVGLVDTRGKASRLDILHRLALQLESRLLMLPDTREVLFYGAPEDEILVEVAPWRLAAAGLDINDLVQAIDAADVVRPAGVLHGSHNALLLAVDTPARSMDQIRQIPLRHVGSAGLLRIADVAEVRLQPRHPPRSLAIIDGLPGVMLAARVIPQARIDQWSMAARAALAAFSAGLPAGIEARLVFEQNHYTEARFASLRDNFFLGVLFVGLILVAMLGLRYGLLVALMIPVTVALVLAALMPLGVALDQISVTGLIVALGLLIDNGIIVADSYRRLRARGKATAVALAAELRQLLPPLSAATLTSVLIFLPMALLDGPNGEFIHGLGVTVILSVAFSLLISLTLLPALLGYFGDRSRQESKALALPAGPGAWLLTGLLKRPWLGVGVALLLPLAGFITSQDLPRQFFPPVDRDQFQLQLQLPAGASLQQTRRVVRQARQILRGHAQIVADHWVVGGNAPQVYYNVISNQSGATGYAQALVYVDAQADLHQLLPLLQQQLMDALPQAMALVLPFTQGASIDAPIEIKLFGPDLDVVQMLSDRIRLILSQTEQVTYSASHLAGGRPQVQLSVDRALAELLDTDADTLAGTLAGQLDGRVAANLVEEGETVAVRVRTRSGSDLREVLQYPMVGSGAGVPLDALVQVELIGGTNAILRENHRHGDLIWGFLQPYRLPDAAQVDFQRRLDAAGFSLPQGYSMHYGGESEQRDNTQRGMLALFVPLLIAMLVVVVLTFNSFRMAAVIALSALLSLGGGLFSLWLFAYPLGFMSIMGLMGLLGLAVNDSIVVLNALHGHLSCRDGATGAVIAVVLKEARHLLATTLTTIAGFLPLMLWGGSFWPPLAIVMIGGVFVATLLALLFIPGCYILIHRWSLHGQS
jgi:multidrug efflux pump subunit AcrB